MTVAVVDCGSGNLRSVRNALLRAQSECGAGGGAEVTSDPQRVLAAERIVLPGVGAFATCRRGLEERAGLMEAMERKVIGEGAPFLGICVGMQLLADTGRERETTAGLGWLGGEVARLAGGPGLRIPHMGWNDLRGVARHPLFEGIGEGEHVYFVHSYAYAPKRKDDIAAVADYGGPVTAAVARGNIAGTQFHPEKSQAAGIRLLANFLRWEPGP